MRVSFLKEYLETLPDNMEVFVQTCEGDLCSPLNMQHFWQTEAFVDEKFGNLEPNKLVITAFVKGQKRYETKNDGRGVIAIYPSEQKE